MLKKFICSLTVIMALSIVAFSQDDPTTLTGHIIDKACSANIAKKDDPQAAAANEGRGCILMASCVKSGLGIYADGKFTELDANGVTLAKAALEKSKKDKGAVFKVTGKLTGGKMAVTSVEEVN